MDDAARYQEEYDRMMRDLEHKEKFRNTDRAQLLEKFIHAILKAKLNNMTPAEARIFAEARMKELGLLE